MPGADEAELVAEVRADYEARAEKRRETEAGWRLNMRFVRGDQYCYRAGESVFDAEPEYPWQERQTFNHIASIVETRLAKLGRVRPAMSVRPASGDNDDVKAARTAGKILDSASVRLDLPGLLSRGTMWSEICGTAFYKLVWDGDAADGEGDVYAEVCPPFEIYPESLSAEDVTELKSVIHARAVHTDDILAVYGKSVPPEPPETLPAPDFADAPAGCATVIERYTCPDALHPDGELAVVAGGELLYRGPLPDGLPFVRQVSIARPGRFFGASMVERTIPIQRAYNAVKNRKHEFMNRLAGGVIAVEDGSVDVESLEAEGLCPGRIVVYRQGATPPRIMDSGRVPGDFSAEEDRLLNEFVSVSGVSEIMRTSSVPSSLSSGTALQLLIEQDDTRLSVTAEHINACARGMAKRILMLYKRYAVKPRLARIVGADGDIELLRFTSADITSDDVVCDSGSEISATPASRQNMLFELLRSGLLYDENGRLDATTRYKILSVLGYGGWEQLKDEETLHYNRAERENAAAAAGGTPSVSEIDDHDAHIAAHTRYLLGAERQNNPDPALEERLLAHIRAHKNFKAVEAEAKKV